MTIFGILWIGALIIAAFRNIKLLFVLTILSSVLQCDNVFVINGTGIGPQVITSIVFIMKVFLIKKDDWKTNKKFFLIAISCISILIVALISLIINNKLNENFLRYMQLVAYVVCFICMSKISNEIDEDFIYSCITGITIFLITVGFIQILITTGFLPRLSIIKELLYNDTLSDVIYFTRNNYFRILSTYMEPSYYACFLVGAFYYFIIIKKKNIKNYILITLIFIQIIFTFSSTAYGTFAILGIIYFLIENNFKIKLAMLALGITSILVLYFGFYDVLDTVIFSKAQSGSANARFAWNDKAMKVFEENKIIGTGYKTTRASSVVCTILAEMGIIGLLSYGVINYFVVKDIFYLKGKNDFKQELGIRMAILGVLIAQIIAVPDIDICVYWMWMNILATLIPKRIKYGGYKKNE